MTSISIFIENLVLSSQTSELITLQYASVSQEPDAEAGDVHQHGKSAVPLNPRPVGSQAHVHCEVCDRQMDRREKARHQEYKCRMVSKTFIFITLFMMIFGIVAVTSINKAKKDHK
jgi:hypothetical protein